MAVGDTHVFPGFLTPVLTQLFFRKQSTTFPTCFCRGERRKYAGKKICLNWGSNSQPPGHESGTFTTEPPGLGLIFGTKVQVIDTHMLLPRSSPKVKVKYQGHICQKMAFSLALVFLKHTLFADALGSIFTDYDSLVFLPCK